MGAGKIRISTSNKVGERDYTEQTGETIGTKRANHVKAIDKPRNAIGAVQTTITDTATKINLPEDAEDFSVYHDTLGKTLYFGENNAITISANSAPLTYKSVLVFEGVKSNDNNLYGIMGTGLTLTVYAIGNYKL